MTGRKQNAVRVPREALRLLALDALLRYVAAFGPQPGNTAYRQILARLTADDDAE
jgi:hypothetical protein